MSWVSKIWILQRLALSRDWTVTVTGRNKNESRYGYCQFVIVVNPLHRRRDSLCIPGRERAAARLLCTAISQEANLSKRLSLLLAGIVYNAVRSVAHEIGMRVVSLAR